MKFIYPEGQSGRFHLSPIMALGFFQRLLEDLRKHHGLLKATPTLQSALVLKHIGLEVKLNFCRMSDIVLSVKFVMSH